MRPQAGSTRPDEGTTCIQRVLTVTVEHFISNRYICKSRHQLGKHGIAECRIGKAWKTAMDNCSIPDRERLEQKIANKRLSAWWALKGPADIYIHTSIHTHIYVYI